MSGGMEEGHMRTLRTALLTLLAVATALLSVSPARADVASDRAAAILVFPRVLVTDFTPVSGETFERIRTDTTIQISNTTTDPVSLHCFYVNANSTCSVTGIPCDSERLPVNCPLSG